MCPQGPSPTLVCLIGAPAVGKTTVGQQLCRLTGFKLFDGHVIADVLTPYFPFGTAAFSRLGVVWRRMFLEEARQSGLDLVTTVAWRFDVPEDGKTISTWLRPYIEQGSVICVELVASLEVRLTRNRNPSRSQGKNAYWVTDTYLRDTHAAHRYDSGGAFPLDVPHLRLETDDLSVEVTARKILEEYDLA